MMNKLNCWEFMKCGNESEGDKTDKLERYPVASESLANGLNGGVNGGRICWVIAEIYCGRRESLPHLQQKHACFSCEFRCKVMAEEGLLSSAKEIGSYLMNLREYQKISMLE